MRDRTRSSVMRLGALFSALLAACSERPFPGESDTDGATGETGTSGDPSTSSGSTGGPSTTVGTSSTTDGPTTDAPPSPTTTTSPPSTSGEWTSSSSECVWADHFIELTAEEYAHWVEHGAPPPADTTGGDDTGESTGGSTAGDTEAGTAGDTGTTGGDGWSHELCVKICEHEVPDVYEVFGCEKKGVDAEGDVEIYCEELVSPCDGRSHACIRSRGAEVGFDPVGAWFARATHDEAASVYAFIALGRELAQHGAPPELLAGVRAAVRDELRHARATGAIARRHGGELRPPRRTSQAPRSLLALAVENAIEGCVRETWAALSAAHQALTAEDEQIRREMAEIAGDEARHAELAWALDSWLMRQLDADQRAEVEAARRAAADALVRSLAAQARDPRLVRVAGVPDRATTIRLASGLARALWSTAA